MLEKGIDFEYKEQDPYDKTPEFLAINPRGLVPALIHGNDVVIESLIINGLSRGRNWTPMGGG